MKEMDIMVPRGNSKEAVKARGRIIHDYYQEWRHVSKSYLSTLAVLQLDAILTNAKKVKETPKDMNSKNQEKFDKIQYCITAIEPETRKASVKDASLCPGNTQ